MLTLFNLSVFELFLCSYEFDVIFYFAGQTYALHITNLSSHLTFSIFGYICDFSFSHVFGVYFHLILF